MTISATPEGVRVFRVEGFPLKFRNALEPAFISRIQNLSCLCSARLDMTTYSLYIQGVCSKSISVKGATLAVCYRLQLDTANEAVGEEVYYYGYACNIPSVYRPLGGSLRDTGTSIFYDGDSVTNTLLIDLSGSIPSAEIDRIIALTSIGATPEHADFIRVRFQGDTFIDAAYHHIGGARVTAD